MKGRGAPVGPCSCGYSWFYDWYERRRLPPGRGDHRGRPAPALDRRGEGLDRGRGPRPGGDHLGGGAPLRAAPEPAVRLCAWLTDVLERMVSGRTKAHELERLLPWNWKAERLPAGRGCWTAGAGAHTRP